MHFSYSIKENKTTIFWKGKVIKNLKSKEHDQFCDYADKKNDNEMQLIMARLTGNFKRGNEKQARNHHRNSYKS